MIQVNVSTVDPSGLNDGISRDGYFFEGDLKVGNKLTVNGTSFTVVDVHSAYVSNDIRTGLQRLTVVLAKVR